MFFNEGMYLEEEELDQTTVDQDIQEANANFAAAPLEEGKDLEILGMERMAELNEQYFNVREKMMNIEHVAAMKRAQGLVSESETLMSEGVDTFIEKTKNFFVNLGKIIKELFQRFVNFVTSLFVSTKSVLNMDAKKAWQAKGKGFRLKVKILNVDTAQMNQAAEFSEGILKDLKNDINIYKSANNADVDEDLDTFKSTKPKDMVQRYLVASILREDGNQQVLQKQEVDLDENLFIEFVQYAKNYKGAIDSVKKNKQTADTLVKDAIKALNNRKSTDINSKRITVIRKCGSHMQKVFSKLISVMQTYYRQCVAIAKRVIASGNAEKTKKDFKNMYSEGFDVAAYFES